MKVSIQWLNSYLKERLSTNEIVAALERTEVEIEEVITPPKLDKKVITAKVVNVIDHPNADKLRLVDIEFGKTKRRVVCGAPNVRKGLVVAYAQPGSVLPEDFVIGEREIRGEKSAGMLASAKELGMGNDHSGIVELDPDLPLGISLCDIENMADIVDVKTPANRWDLLSVLGLAREISANSSKNQVVEPKREKIEYKNREVVKVKETGECERFISAVFKIDSNAETPAWIVENLEAAGMRAIHPVVDITNFVMLETGQPSHAYDSKKLKGALQVRFARAGELLSTLDGVERKLTKEDLVIADNSGAIGLAGVMGGASSEVSTQTQEIVLEVANFNKTTVRRSALRHGLRSEASTRFEKGLPLPLPCFAFERAAQLLKEICKAELIGDVNDQLYAWPWISFVGLRQRRAEMVLGTKLNEKEIIEGLRARGFSAEHFSLSAEAKKHLGKPYVYGASFKKNGEEAFDCSYLVERIYSKIGIAIGHTAQQQFNSGKPVEKDNLKPGDLVFYSGHWEKLDAKSRGDIGHVGMYLGKNQVIEASEYEFDTKIGKYIKRKTADVRYTTLDSYTSNPTFKGARRYTESFNHIIAVVAPWWRTDIVKEVDLIEEAAKILGYENMPSKLPELPPMETADHQMLPGLMGMREDLVAAGLFEVTTYSFVSEQDLLDTHIDPTSVLAIENPMSKEQAYLRNSLLSSHLQTVARNNTFYEKEYGFFELARIYEKSPRSKTLAQESWRLAICAVGKNGLERIKSVLDMCESRYQLRLAYKRSEEANFLPGRTATLQSQRIPEVRGLYGQVKPICLKKFSISDEIVFAEIILPDQSIFAESTQKSVSLLPYQLVSRDLTLELPNEVLWQNIALIVKSQKRISRVQFLQEFASEELTKTNKKRVSMRIWIDCGANPSQKEITKYMSAIESTLLADKTLKQVKIV